MPKVTIEKDGETQEIDVSLDNITFEEGETPSGFVAQGAVDDILKQRLQRKERSLKSDLKSDDSFFQEAARERGIELREDMKPKGYVKDEEIQQLRKTKAEYESLKQTHQSTQQQLSQMRDVALENTILQTAGSEVRDDLKDVFVSTIKSHFEWDEQEGTHVLKNSNGEVRYDTSSGAAKLAGPDVLIEELRAEKPGFFKPTKMNGSPGTKPSSGSSSAAKRMTRAEQEKALAQPEKYSDKEWEAIVNAEIIE